MLNKYALIDRDGTIIYEPTLKDTKPGDIPYQIDSLEKLKILPGVIEGLKKLQKLNYKLVMISNQDNLGSKNYPQSKFDRVQDKLLKILKKNSIKFSNILICPHLPSNSCKCRKPKTGLLQNIIRDINKKNSLVIGDRSSDEQLAKKLNIKFIAIKTNQTFNLNL